MPNRFWCFTYASACFMNNCLPNSQCMNLLPHEQLFGRPPSITKLYPLGAEEIVHITVVQQCHKLSERGIVCRLLKPLMWDPACDKMVQSTSVIFPRFQLMGKSNPGKSKGLLGHIVNTDVLGKVATERYFEEENGAIEMLPLTANLAIPEHLGQALSG
ncbi:hypothetical protein O181_028031 [Austropuccinia psidii MF-1]|uniref:Uncharacterized protein n=1 Tax=Austropuccinia psidii MF-1 TaxID=1389203 RepID=A0A9Q3CTN4_9BASI|nr:hypothetical protein [Austropuccinia psidii MF-1]